MNGPWQCPVCAYPLEESLIPEQPAWQCKQCGWRGDRRSTEPGHDRPERGDVRVLDKDQSADAASTPSGDPARADDPDQ